MSSTISELTTTVRLQDWWKAKAANLLAVLYSVTLITALPFTRALVLLAASLITIIGIGGFGHVINDICDIPIDAAAGKPNRLARLNPWKRFTLVGVLLAIALLPWLVLPFDRLSIALLLIEFSLLLAYAIPPLRLKQRVIWAVLTDAGYAYALPALLAAHTFFLATGVRENRALALSLFVWQMALGIRHFLNHLALDRTNDIRSGISTLATIKGSHYIHALIRHGILPIELLGFLGYLLVMSEYARFHGVCGRGHLCGHFVTSHCACDRPELPLPDLPFLEDAVGLALPGRSSAGFVGLSCATRLAVLCAPVGPRSAVCVIRQGLQDAISAITTASRDLRRVTTSGFLCNRKGESIACPRDKFQATPRRFARQHRSG